MMSYRFPFPAAADAVWTIAPWLLFIIAAMPLVRIVMRRTNKAWIDPVLAVTFVILLYALPSMLHTVRNLILSASGFLPADSRHNRMSVGVWLLTSDVLMLNLGWLIVELFWRPSGKKLVECLTVYGTGGFIALVMSSGCYYPAEAAWRVQCRNNLKQIGLAFHNYHDTFHVFPSLAERPGQPERTWRVDLLPYMDHAPLRKEYVDTAPWDAPQNLPLAKRIVPALQCPADPNQQRDGMFLTGYSGVRGRNTLFPNGRGITFREITDGSSNTIMIVEACGWQIVWTEPRDIDLAEQTVGVNLPGEQPGRSRAVVSSYHQGGGHVLLGDGSVHFISEKIAPAVLQALLTADGGEAVPEDY